MFVSDNMDNSRICYFRTASGSIPMINYGKPNPQTILEIIERNGDWGRARFFCGFEGWIRLDKIINLNEVKNDFIKRYVSFSNWDKKIYLNPTYGSNFINYSRKLPLNEHNVINVLETKYSDKMLWIKTDLLSTSQVGWIPVLQQHGGPENLYTWKTL